MASIKADANSRVLYLRLLGYLVPYWKAFALAVAGMVATAATEPAFPAIMKYLLDSGFKTDDARLVLLIPMGIVLLFAVRGLLSFCTSYLMTWISTHLVADLRRAMFAKILVLPTQVFHEQSSGKLISRLLYDADSVNQATTTVLVTAVRETLTAVALLSYLLYLDWKLTLVTLTIAPVIALVVQGFSRRIRQASRNSLEAIRTMSHTIEEAVGANKVIKVYGGQAQETARIWQDTERFRRSMMREAVPAQALEAEFRGMPLRDLAREVLAISRLGLRNRARKNRDGYDETNFLAPLDEVVARGTTAAEEMISAFHTRWGNSIEPVFLEYAY